MYNADIDSQDISGEREDEIHLQTFESTWDTLKENKDVLLEGLPLSFTWLSSEEARELVESVLHLCSFSSATREHHHICIPS